MNKISDLPDEIIQLIKEYIPIYKLVFVNSIYYKSYHCLIKKQIPFFENYIRDTIRRDNEYVFEQIIRENLNYWVKKRQYIYKNMIFTNYIYFIIHYCIENNSDKCRLLIKNYLSKGNLCINQHKKNVVKYINE
jgi:hypothetical protein